MYMYSSISSGIGCRNSDAVSTRMLILHVLIMLGMRIVSSYLRSPVDCSHGLSKIMNYIFDSKNCFESKESNRRDGTNESMLLEKRLES